MDFIENFIESSRNPGWVRLAFYFLYAAAGASLLAMFQKFSILGYGVVKTGHSREARSARNNLKYISYILFGISFFLVLLGFTTKGDNDYFAEKEDKEIIEEIKDELTPKGGYGELPVIRMKRNCFKRAAHEYENFALFAGSFYNEENAIKRVSTLDMYNIRDVGRFELLCDSIEMVGGKYFVFLGRRCNTKKSIEQYEQKYETMFREDDYVDLKIVKFMEE